MLSGALVILPGVSGMYRIVLPVCLLFFSLLACTDQSLRQPTVDIHRAVELTVTSLASTLTADTPGPKTVNPVPLTATLTSSPVPSLVIPSLPGCNLKNPTAETGQVVKVVDGDTIDVLIRDRTYAVRYIGVDTAESGEPNGREAQAANASLVDGQGIILVRDISETDPYHRLLRYVFLSDGTFVNEQLVRIGIAVAKPYPPDTACEDRFATAQEEAMRLGIGVWARNRATETVDPGVGGDSVIVDPSCSQFNAPGDDNQKLNEEYVCLRNPGETPVDLTEWIIEDEYGWIFTFPKFSLAAEDRVLVHTGCGSDGERDVFWCRTETAIWNNGGDCVHLKNQLGEFIQDYCY